MKELIEIQTEIKVPKTQFNKFGNYYFRNQEDILEAVKPLLKKHNCSLTVSDEIVQIGQRIYVKATATLKSEKESIFVTAFAREDESIKGMSLGQLTGSTSSYARKYALNGLFAIDDAKDDDTTNTHGKEEQNATETTETATKTKEYPEDNRPWLSDRNFKIILERIIAGEEGLFEKTVEAFKMKKEYKKQLEEANNFLKGGAK